MKKILYLIILITFTLAGCEDGFVSYEKENVIESLEVLSFEPEIPDKIPFTPTDIKVMVGDLGGKQKSYMAVKFINKKGREITFRAIRHPNGLDFTDETVKIEENLEGRYGDQNDTKLLKWDKDGVYYEVFADSDFTSKKELIKIAEISYKVN
ncbi:DUF4367 domain-containing protein [Halobacillus shinanisalinarum]|uniref:DUF4367 domain-containing protein n=1 Tax=Halobacillus shinanisalinarum TaxID=2932258 RepID=A0ABY4H2A0_9BACI|nr:DUF4367 domain-containing protein [Halobacillus shinanisalinarum]UOQ94259.1 DUF4367 domain-containing protein [Halobacillus shinanisalinarum]